MLAENMASDTKKSLTQAKVKYDMSLSKLARLVKEEQQEESALKAAVSQLKLAWSNLQTAHMEHMMFLDESADEEEIRKMNDKFADMEIQKDNIIKIVVPNNFETNQDEGEATNLVREVEKSTKYTSKKGKQERLAEKLKKQSALVSHQAGLEIITPKDIKIMTDKNIKKISIGNEELAPTREKTALVVGTTGAGKSTFLNSLANLAFGVEIEDNFRFKIVDIEKSGLSSQSVTKDVTAYVLNENKFGFKLTIVDTPGFGDTKGLLADKKTTSLIKELFENQGDAGIQCLDAVFFVVKSTDTRLTAQMKHNFNSVLQLFGKDLIHNVCVVATFSDASAPPVKQVLDDWSKDQYGAKFSKIIKVNNSAFFQGIENQEEKQVHEFFWKIGVESIRKLLDHLEILQPVSLQLSKDVLTEREKLELIVLHIQKSIKDGINHLELMRNEAKVMNDFSAALESNKNFVFSVKKPKVVKKDISGQGIYTTTCLNCSFTCHLNCMYANDSDKMKCCAMKSNGYCNICPCHGIWSDHTNVPFVYENTTEEVTMTSQELKAKYLKAKSGLSQTDAMMNELGQKFGNTQMEIAKKIKELRKTLARLKVSMQLFVSGCL